jgi:hypothetical protein
MNALIGQEGIFKQIVSSDFRHASERAKSFLLFLFGFASLSLTHFELEIESLELFSRSSV